MNVTRNYLSYLDELELRHPLHTPAYGIPGISQNASVFRLRRHDGSNLGITSNLSTSNVNPPTGSSTSKDKVSSKSASVHSPAKTAWDLEAEDNPAFDLYPRRFRCSGRIGRGGRFILDRKPVSDYKFTLYGCICHICIFNNSVILKL